MTTPAETFFRPVLRGPLSTETASGNGQWAGRTTISSGATSVTVSTQVVNSNSIILHTLQATTRQNSGVASTIEVSTISPGNFFTLAYADGVNHRADDATIMWWIIRA
jgi:hypothetical protein